MVTHNEVRTVRCLVISDIHANRAALEAVLNDAAPFDMVWCLGDLVGYGPDPNECVERVQELDHLCLAGNHDWAALGQLSLEQFNLDARHANAWTRRELSPAARKYLEGLPLRLTRDDTTLVHGSPREPIWEYLLDPGIAAVNFRHFSTSLCLVGHTHIPSAFEFNESKGRCYPRVIPYDTPIPLNEHRMIINPGSVGQPRDGDPRASYGILDTEARTWEQRRVAYPVEITQERMRVHNLPQRLIARLALGR